MTTRAADANETEINGPLQRRMATTAVTTEMTNVPCGWEEEHWRTGGGLEEDWSRIGGGLEEDWRRIGGLEEDWRRVGGALEKD